MGRTKVPEDQLEAIRWMLSPSGGFSLRQVAEMYGVSATQILRIRRGERKGPPTGTAPAKPTGTT